MQIVNRRPHALWQLAAALTVVAVVVLLVLSSQGSQPGRAKLQVVASENFWGSLAMQLGGSQVDVASIVSDPNADPHEYETSSANARSFAEADYVIVNGAGYDSWSGKLLSAGGKPSRKVLDIATLLGKKDGDNPHFWYSPTYVSEVVARMDADLAALDPAHAAYYRQRLKTVQASLANYQGRISRIKQQFAGVKVAATEDIFVYLAQATGLDLVSPPAFITAIAEGTDPPTASVAQFQQQLQTDSVRVLVYNTQTVTPLTDNIKRLASAQGIPIVGITETMQPAHGLFQDWMDAQVAALENALKASEAGR